MASLDSSKSKNTIKKRDLSHLSSAHGSEDDRLMKKQKTKEKKLKKKKKKELKKEKKRTKELQKLSENEKNSLAEEETDIGPAAPASVKGPVTKEQWMEQQSIVKRIYDDESGRCRLIKGSGEVLEECVSYSKHKEINKQATRNDGEFFQKTLKSKVSTW